MTTPQAPERSVPNVPEGTPGRDSRAELPAALPPGPKQPWRRHGPGNRAWVVVVTAIAGVVLAVGALVAVGIGAIGKAIAVTGTLVLDPTEYQATESGCTGVDETEQVKKGARITFRSGDQQFSTTLDEGTLRLGMCRFRFELSSLDASSRRTYAVRVGDVPATPVSGAELTGGSGIVVYVAPR